MSFTAELVQYMMPNGRAKDVTTELPDEARDDYNAMTGAGCRLEAEVLVTDEVSVTIFDPDEEVDVDIEVVPNGPGVQQALLKMLKRRLWDQPRVEA